MKRSKQVEERFEECLELVFKGENPEDCARRYPDDELELRGLLKTAIAARKALEVQPSLEFRERARQQLYAAQRERAAKSEARWGFRWSWQPRWATTLAAVLLAIVAGSSTVLASANSMPDQPLYAVKHAAQSVRVALTISKSAKAEVYASLADQRVREIVYLADKGAVSQVDQVTDDLNLYLDRIATLSGGVNQDASAFSQYGGEMGTASIPRTTEPAERSAIEAIPTPSPAETGPPILAAPGAPTTAAQPPAAPAAAPPVTIVLPPAAEDSSQKGIFVAAPPPVVVSGGPPSKALLKARITFQAAQNTARLRAALDKAPSEAKSALLRAIAVSQSGYEKALQSMEGQP